MTGEGTVGRNAAAVIRGIRAYNEGDIEEFLAMAHPEVDWEVAPEHPAATTHRGFDAVREYHEDWRNTLRGLRVELERVEEKGADVVTVCRLRGQGAESGADVVVEIAFLATFRDGKAIRVEEFLNPDEALRALESARSGS